MIRLKKIMITAALAASVMFVPTGCTHDDVVDEVKLKELTDQVRVQVAYDASDVVFRFTWKSQNKLYPEGLGNVGRKYPGHFHDLLQHNGTKFDRLPSGQRMEEDRVSLMVDKHTGGIANFVNVGCAITCHSGMDAHNLTTPDILDHWHWRGGRSGPMGYAEDAAVNNVERIRDNAGTPPSKFTRSGGDRLRENQAALSGSSHNVQIKGFPRFVFNKGKTVGGFTIPKYFIADVGGLIIANPYVGLPLITDITKNRSLLVAYQDKTFDPIDKVNAIDLAYLLYVSLGSTGHLPAHLQDESSADFLLWRNHWATETGIAATATTAATNKLDDIYQEWVDSGEKAMVARSIGFIYNSDQHDVTSKSAYNVAKNEWTVELRRRLNTGSVNDADLSGLSTGAKFTIAFAMHDSGGGSETHDISLPYLLSNEAGADIRAVSVGSANAINWNIVPIFDTHWVTRGAMNNFTYEWLKSGSHPGGGVLGATTCKTCHTKDANVILNDVVK